MRKTLLVCMSLLVSLGAKAQLDAKSGYPITPVPFTSVKVTDSFWGQRLEASRKTTIPLAFSKCEETGRYENFIKAANPSKDYKVGGLAFDDTDVYKTIEGASYSMQTFPDAKLDKYIDSVLVIVAAAQEPDGYLYTSRTMNPEHPHEWAGTKRWEKEEDLSHELYNLGHMLDGAIAHYQATGKRNFLDIAIKYADCAVREVGPNPGQADVTPGHQIPEMALARLYVITGEKKYLDLAKFLIDRRGYTPMKHEYSQSHKPVLEQDEAVGHAVRAAYMYSGIADVAALTGDKAYIDAIDRIWDNVVQKKLYITGGIGATGAGEAFGKNYELPNMSAYCETCAAIANVYWNYRLFLLHGEAKYYDVLERTLYNGLISGVSLEGDGFFYPNPLESIGQHARRPWFGCACCPSNISRFIPSVPGYVYAVDKNDIYVNLFMSNTSKLKLEKNEVTLTQETSYPWNGDIKMTVAPKKAKQAFAVKVRIPGWVQGSVVPSDLYSYNDAVQLSYTVKVNGQVVESQIEKGYFTINRAWKKGDVVEVHFDMEPRLVSANDKVEADRGKVAVERGPVVYCAEWPDNDFRVNGTLMNRAPKFTVEKTKFVSGEKGVQKGTYDIMQIKTTAQSLSFGADGKLDAKDVTLTLIPYYAWAHRGSGPMTVWLSYDLSSTSPTLPPTIASKSKISGSTRNMAISAINDNLAPKNPADASMPYFHWWPAVNTTEWIAYTFDAPTEVSECTVFWFDDSPWGGCRVPQSWKVYYKDGDNWVAVENTTDYPTNRKMGSTVKFKKVKTSALKLEVVQPEKHSSGLFEWSVK